MLDLEIVQINKPRSPKVGGNLVYIAHFIVMCVSFTEFNEASKNFANFESSFKKLSKVKYFIT